LTFANRPTNSQPYLLKKIRISCWLIHEKVARWLSYDSDLSHI
jgi:hypothetical protein